MKPSSGRLPPVIILGGTANALSIARNLGRRGLRVHALNDHHSHVRYCRFARYLPAPWLGSDEATWKAFLLGPESDSLRGAVLISPSDVGIEIIAHNRAASCREIHPRRLQPRCAAGHARQAAHLTRRPVGGVDTPRFWRVETLQDVLAAGEELLSSPGQAPAVAPVLGTFRREKVPDRVRFRRVDGGVTGRSAAPAWPPCWWRGFPDRRPACAAITPIWMKIVSPYCTSPNASSAASR